MDTYNSTSSTIIFNGTASDDTAVINVSLYLNGVLNETNSSGLNNSNYIFTKTFTDGNYNWTYETCDINGCTKATVRSLNIDTTPMIEFVAPTITNNTNLTTTSIYGTVDITETYFDNLTFYLYNSTGLYDSQLYEDATRFHNFTGLPDNDYYFNVSIWTTTGQSNNTETREYNIDTTSPLISPANNLTDLVTFTMPIQSIWNYTATDPHIDTCYFNNSDNATYQILTACNNSITTSWVTSGSKTIQFCANDTNGLETCNTTSFTIHEINHSQSDTPDPAVEGDDATFSLNVNLTNIPSTTAKLILNGTSYSVTGTATTNAYVFSKTINIPNTFGNITGKNQNWFWNYTIAGIRNQTTATQTITVYELDIDDCSSYGEVILNLSLFDEEGSSYVNETAGANIEVDLVLTSATNSSISLTYNHTFENDNNPAICLPVGVLNSTYNIDFTIGFDSTDHVWEFFI